MNSIATKAKRVLVTGSTGAIGQPVCQHLQARGHTIRGFARRPTPNVADHIIGDLADREKVRQAVDGMDTIIHLGAYPNPADFIDVLLGPNVIGLHYICEAAADYGVKRLILASTLQVVSGHGFPDRAITVADGPKPVNHYALTKAWAEIAGDMVARNHHISVINVRIGWLPRNAEEAQRLVESRIGTDVFFSHDDANRFHERCVEAENPQPGECMTLFATSKPLNVARLDLTAAKAVIGYEPQDTWPEGLPFSVT